MLFRLCPLKVICPPDQLTILATIELFECISPPILRVGHLVSVICVLILLVVPELFRYCGGSTSVDIYVACTREQDSGSRIVLISGQEARIIKYCRGVPLVM